MQRTGGNGLRDGGGGAFRELGCWRVCVPCLAGGETALTRRAVMCRFGGAGGVVVEVPVCGVCGWGLTSISVASLLCAVCAREGRAEAANMKVEGRCRAGVIGVTPFCGKHSAEAVERMGEGHMASRLEFSEWSRNGWKIPARVSALYG